VDRHGTAHTPPWWEVVQPATPLAPEDLARITADVDIDDLDDANWFSIAPMLLDGIANPGNSGPGW
jgi:hypothetical protein